MTLHPSFLKALLIQVSFEAVALSKIEAAIIVRKIENLNLSQSAQRNSPRFLVESIPTLALFRGTALLHGGEAAAALPPPLRSVYFLPEPKIRPTISIQLKDFQQCQSATNSRFHTQDHKLNDHSSPQASQCSAH